MSCIHFKFKSSLDYEKLTFDGLHISLSDLKEAIMKQKKIGSVNQYTLSVKDAQSKKEYTDDQEMIPRNTSVIISRVPLANPVKIPKTQRKDHTLSQPEPASMTTISAPSSFPPLTSNRQLTASELQETADLASANASEEDKVKAMMTQSSKDFDPSRYVSVPPSKGGPKRHPPPPTYICHRCGKKGHWIQLCPTNGDPSFDNRNYKRSLGTPASQIISANANMPGVMLDRHGNLVMKKVDYQAYMDAQRKVKPEAPAKLDVPDELVCPICKKLVKDAVIIQCCSESFCYECIQEYLCENEFICPLCKAEDVSPETLVPNKALRTAAKNFQLKESEQKSVSEARGYVPIVTPQQVVLSSKNLPPVSAESAPSSSSSSAAATAMATSGVSNGPTGGVAEVPSKATPTKDKDIEKAERGASEATDPPTVSAEKEDKPSLSLPPPAMKKSSSPTPQPPRPKTRSDAILDRIIAKNQTPPPTATPTSSSIVTTTTSSSRPIVAPPTVVAAPPTAASLLGVASGLAPPTIAAASALLSGAAAAATRGSGSLLGLPRGPTPSATLPGQGAVLTTSAILPPPPPVVITEPNQSQEESAKLERIAAELVLAAAVNTKKSVSPPPLTAAEFYRQQKMLRLITKQTRKRTPSPYSGISDYSRSNTPDSFRLPSDSSSLSRSHSPSGSSYSDSPSRSRSRSPIPTHRSHRSKKHRSHRHKHEKVRYEKSREKGKERKSGHHHSSRKKRKRHLSPESEERLSKSHYPDRKKHRDNITLSALVEEDLLSPASSLPLSPDVELESQGTSSSSHRKHRHKKRSKAKRSRQRRRTDEEMDVDLMAGPVDFPADYPGDHSLEAADQEDTTQPIESVIKDGDSEGRVELAVENEGAGGEESKADEAVTDSDAIAMAEVDGGHIKSSSSLVPYQDSSTTETEGREHEGEGEDTRRTAANDNGDDPGDDQPSSHGSKERPSSTSSSVSLAGDREVNDAIEELEATMKEGVTPANDDDDNDDDTAKSGGDEAMAKKGVTDDVKSDDLAVDEGAPPTSSAAGGEEEEEEEGVEDSLLIALHVDEDAIDQDSAELLDAECPNKGKEDGEITDSDKDDDNGDDDDKRDTGPLSSSSTDKAPPIFSPSSSNHSSHVTSSPSKLASLKSPTNVSSVAAAVKRRGGVSPAAVSKATYYSDDERAKLGSGQDNDSDVDLRVLLNKNKQQLHVQPLPGPGARKKHFASAVTVTSGYMSSSQPRFESSTPVDEEEWSSDDDRDSAGSSSSDGSSSEAEKLRSLKKVSSSKHSSSSRRHKRKQHSSSKSRREKEKKRKKAKVYSESKKKSRREKEKEREREKAKKQKKHKKSEKYSTKYAH